MMTPDENTPKEDRTARVEDLGERMGSVTGMAKMVAGLRQEHWEVDMAFENLSYTVDVKKTSLGIQTVGNQFSAIYKNLSRTVRGLGAEKQQVKVLNNVSGAFAAGTTTLVLGPPGCGVTTLFKALSGRIDTDKNRVVQGKLSYSGYSPEEVHVKKLSNYIDQVDTHLPVLTVRETLEFAFQCYGGPKVDTMLAGAKPGSLDSNGELANALNDYPNFIVEHFGLNNCADTIVGNELLRGVSGGEKKRVTTTEFLMGRRPLVFADQISTGLDSAATFDISRRFCQAARDMRLTYVVALLQPPPEVYDLFDEVMILAEGNIVYHGARNDVLPYFESIGFTCPDDTDVAEFCQEVTLDVGRKYANRKDYPKSVTALVQAWLSSPYSEPKRSQTAEFLSNRVESPVRDFEYDISRPVYETSWAQDLKLVTARQFKLVNRDMEFIQARLGQAVFMGVLLGTVFLKRSADIGPQNPAAISQRYGIMFMSVVIGMLSGMAGMPVVLTQRPVMYKHRDSYLFRISNYVLSELITVIPITIVETIVFSLLVFFLTAIVPIDAPDVVEQFFKFTFFLFTINVAFSTFLRFIGALSQTPEGAQVNAGMFIALAVLCSGFMITQNNIPDYFIWIYWINPLAWGIRGMVLTVFTSDAWSTNQQTVALEMFAFETFREQEEAYVWGALGIEAVYLVLGMLGSYYVYTRMRVGATASNAADEQELSHIEEEEDNATVKIPMGREQSMTVLEQSFTRINLQFKNLSYIVPDPKNKKEKLQLLHSISGFAKAGTMTALMGSSGAGKTTLMDVIAGRKTGGTIEGEILVNGRIKEDVSFSRITGYVEQMDIHSPRSTVYEAMLFSAMLRQPAEVSEQEKREFVDAVIDTLELNDIRDRQIGSKTEGGLSTEQAKRLTIGVELAANPSVLFCDEPTSGLDSRAAHVVMKSIRRVAESGRTVVCTIHQPSKDIFEQFDKLLLLRRGGHTVYFGDLGHKSEHLLNYLQAIPGTKPFPNPRYNPANYMLEVIGAGVAAANTKAPDYAEVYKTSALAKTNEAELSSMIEDNLATMDMVTFKHKRAASYPLQQRLLLEKFFVSFWRCPSYNFVRILVYIVMALLFGFALFQLEMEDTASLQSLMGLLFLSTLFMGIININTTIPILTSERAPFYRERAAKMYGVVPYVIAYSIAEVPYQILCSLVFQAIWYNVVGLYASASNFFWFWLVFFIYLSGTTAMGHLVAAALPNEQVATIAASGITTIFGVFAGFLIAVKDIHGFWVFMTYLSPVRYVINALASIQLYCECVVSPVQNATTVADVLCTFNGKQGLCTDSSICDTKSLGCQVIEPIESVFQTTWQNAVSGFGFEYDRVWTDFGALVLFYFGFMVLTAVSLRFVSHQTR